MVSNELNTELWELGAELLPKEKASYGGRVLEELAALRLDELSFATGYFVGADTTNEKVRTRLSERFGAKIIANIELLQRIGRVQFSETQKNIAQLRKLFIELTDDVSIIFIKLAERLAALKLADSAGSEHLEQISGECLYLYSPIAQQLGIRKFYTELEDISFKNLFPEDFRHLEKHIAQRRDIYMSKLNEIRAEIDRLMKKYGIEARYQSRVKRPYSIFRKLKNKASSLEQIFDLLALRIITNSPESCYLALGAVHSAWIPIENRFRDWITYPKANGYRSIQTTVHTRTGDKFEIQIRTEEMHYEAEYGSSAHWSYKQGTETGRFDWINRLREFLENDEYFDNPFAAFDRIKNEMKRDYINILTPKGEIRSLPVGSTPVDYAFTIHTDVGYKVTGARVNGKFVRLKTELKSGDVVDIITNNAATPSRDWLSFVKTSRARSKILRWFKKTEQELFVMEGKEIFDRLKNKYRKKLIGFDDENKFKAGISKLGYKNAEEFYYAISGGATKATLYLLKKIYPNAFKKAQDEEKRARAGKSSSSGPKVRVEGLSGIQTKIAKCCNPIKGEPIVAYITKRSELKIHSQDCAYLKTQHLDESCFKHAEWIEGESFQLVKLKIYGAHYSKLLTATANDADSEKIDVLSTSKAESKPDTDCLLIEIEVKDYSHLNRFIKRLRSNPVIDAVKTG